MKSKKNTGRIIKKSELAAAGDGKIEWSPEIEFDRIDFETQKGPSKEEAKETTRTEPEISVSAWSPGRLDAPSGGGGGGAVKRVAASKVIRLEKGGSEKKGTLPPENPVSVQLLREIILMFPENSVHILRSWYFEKGSGSSESGLPSAERVRIILQSAGKELLAMLFPILSPMERQNMAELLRTPVGVGRPVADAVRREFTEKVKNYS